MNILGLHFGHDAGVCVLRDGEIAACILRERHSRIKHAISLEFSNIESAVAEAGLSLADIDYCAVTSTQNIELIIDRPTELSFSFDSHPGHTAPSTFARLLKGMNADPASRQASSLMELFYNPKYRDSYHFRHYGASFPEYRTRQPENFKPFGWIDQFISSPLWTGGTLTELGALDFSRLAGNHSSRHGFHFPVTAMLAGRPVAGYFINHHMAHAASTYYQSGFEQAAILTHDGFGEGVSYFSGLFCWAENGKIFPLSPNYLVVGALYDSIGVKLGLGEVGPSGKLMGLAAYGKPRFFDRVTVGNSNDWKKTNLHADSWWLYCVNSAREMGYDLKPLADREQMTAPINVDIAASTQKLFEETMLAAVESLRKIIRRTGRSSPNLCMSGGTALNCPANSRIFREGSFANVFIEPGCDDSGLAIGAATALYHNVLDHPVRRMPCGTYASGYLGQHVKADDIQAAVRAAGGSIRVEPCADAAESAARDLANDQIVGWFENRSEIGPRALGHRSILADPRQSANWQRVNRLKGREAWRPFAPAVLASEAAKWFHGSPLPSPYMLFTANVRSNQLPAITHADGTARLQTVDATCGEFSRVIEHFFKMTGVPVLLNTSFNGPGEPIVETPAQAIHFLIHTSLDALYLGGFRITRMSGPIR